MTRIMSNDTAMKYNRTGLKGKETFCLSSWWSKVSDSNPHILTSALLCMLIVISAAVFRQKCFTATKKEVEHRIMRFFKDAGGSLQWQERTY